MNKNKIVRVFALVIFTTLLVLVSETYYYFYTDNNEAINADTFTSFLIDAIGFSLFVNIIIFVSNYFVDKKAKDS